MKDASIKQYHDGEIIVRQGDTAKNLYKILSGNVTLYIDYDTPEEYLVGIRSFPHCFGEMTILADQPSYYAVVSLAIRRSCAYRRAILRALSRIITKTPF